LTFFPAVAYPQVFLDETQDRASPSVINKARRGE
jgi:hypothetical protein